MPLTRVIGLAAVFAVAAMAFVGTSSALAQTHEVVLCKELVTLCPNGKLWPAGTELSLLAGLDKNGNPSTFLGTLNVKCEDAVATAKTENEIGTNILITLLSFEFGKLPTPKLGEGCTNCEKVHGAFSLVAHIGLTSVRFSVKLTMLGCIGLGIECVFEGSEVTVPLAHTGKHASDSGASNLALIEFNQIKLNRTGGSAFCGSESKWDADYALFAAHAPGGSSGLAWPSLDKK